MTPCMISLLHLRLPSYKHFYNVGISCNGCRNFLCNNDIIDKSVDTIKGFVCVSIGGRLLFLCHGTPVFNC